MSDWSLWVLEHGLPAPPDALDDGEALPIARWVGPRFGAVLHISRYLDDEDSERRIDTEVEVFCRSGESWEQSYGSGGSSWYDPPLIRLPLQPRQAFTSHQHCSGNEDWYCCAIDGVAGVDAAWVEVLDADGTTRRPIESALGAFIACSDGKRDAVVRVLDASGVVLVEFSFAGDGVTRPRAAVTDFDRWLRRVTPESSDGTALISGSWLRWMRDVYRRDGPLERDELEALSLRAIITTVELALPTVLDDVERVRGVRPDMDVVSDDAVRIRYLRGAASSEEPPGGLSTPSQLEALVAVADAVLDLLADDERLVPLSCPEHDFGLHPHADESRAVWRCHPGDHVVAEIGRLGEAGE